MRLLVTFLYVFSLVSSMRAASSIATASKLAKSSFGVASLKKEDWLPDASAHKEVMNDLLYPKFGRKKNTNIASDNNLKRRMHSVQSDPIYNFLHTYYRYTTVELLQFSPGKSIFLEGATKLAHGHLFSDEFIQYTDEGALYTTSSIYEAIKNGSESYRYGWINLCRIRDILKATSERPAFLSCYGLHEWAMLYSGRDGASMKQQQSKLSLRLSQQEVDHVVETDKLRCTHFDAWRFFHPDSQPWNVLHPLSRKNQIDYEQPGCIHANMDLFKYAFTLYPLLSSTVLLDSLRLAIRCRKVDMRASPYDVSAFDGCEQPIRIETKEGQM